MGNDLDISAIEQVANDFVAAYRQQVIDSGHFASGRLNDSLSAKVWLHDDSVTVTIDGEAYAKYLTNGTRPHFPPVDKILEWIRIKPVLPARWVTEVTDRKAVGVFDCPQDFGGGNARNSYFGGHIERF